MFKQRSFKKVVQERLGHSSPMMTLEIYAHVILDTQEDIATNLDEKLIQLNQAFTKYEILSLISFIDMFVPSIICRFATSTGIVALSISDF